MRNNYLRIVLFICTFFAAITNSWSQKITASDSSGCAPFAVKFTGIPGSTKILWDFGDGKFKRDSINAVNEFNFPGNYTVTYTATVAGSTITQTIPIQVFGKPIPKFTSTGPLKGCAPLAVSFIDQSTGGGGVAIKKWEWTFGDGGFDKGTNPNPKYVYNLAGQFSVNLIIFDANGCDSSIAINQYITTSKKPTIVITNTPLSACAPPLTVTFNAAGSTSNSTTGAALTYFWSFGNGSVSTVASPPAVTYTALGTYNVKLKVTDNNSCADSTDRKVSISNPLASFFVKDTVCKTVTFVDNSTGTANWDYGDGQTGTSNTHTYTAAGTYFVKLTASASNCKDDTIRKIYVEDVVANFKSVPTYVCNLPASIKYTDQSINAAAWEWTFVPSIRYIKPTPIVSTVKDPTIIFSNMDTNQYSIYKEQYVTVSLKVTTKYGCISTTTTKINLDTINLPTAMFMPDKSQGCAPLKVQFSDSSKSKEKIVKWTYLCGDGTVISGTDPNPFHTYVNPGTYYPKLIIENAKGCIDTSYSIKIVVGKLPTPDFSATPLTVCPGEPVKFTDLTPASDDIDTWHYATDGSFIMSACPGTANPTWSFVATTGAQNVTLTVGSKGCYASVTKTNYITVKGPIATFKTATDCDSSLVYQFTGTLQAADSWTWDLGDGTILSNSTANQLSHKYLTSGNFKVILTAVNATSGCKPSVDTATVFVRQIKARFSDIDTLVCARAMNTFDASASVDVNPECNSGYYWLWGDDTGPGIFSASTAQHTFATPGFYNVKLIVKDANGCRDTTVKKVRAFGITPKFTSDVTYGCLPLTVNFTDKSISDTTITSLLWDFGDGSPTSILKNPVHKFEVAGVNSFLVTQTATNILGCTDVYTSRITISRPDSTFSASKTTLCAGDSVRFLPTYTNHKGYLWNFGDGKPTSTVKSPYHVFTKGGNYAVALQVTDSIGCKGQKKIVNYVQVQDIPIIGFTSPSDGAPNCYPLLAQFTDTSRASIFGYRIWDLGNGSSTIDDKTVGTTYQIPGVYNVSLTVSTTFGCTSILKKTVKVNGPIADFDFSPGLICKGTEVKLWIKDTTRVFTYRWDFGDGYYSSALSPVTHKFNHHPPNGKGVITLKYWSTDSSCVQIATHNLDVHQITAAFNRNDEIAKADTAHCMDIPDLFTNNSLNADSWTWDFGDGATSNVKDPSPHNYTAPGIYPVRLTIKNDQLGCVDTLIKKMIIYPNPVVSVVGGSACLGSSVPLSASGGTSYVWSPPDGLNSTTIANPIAKPTVTTDYSVLVTDANACTSTAKTQVYIQQRPRQITWDTTIIIGQQLWLNAAYQGPNHTYLWTPPDTLSCIDCGIPKIKPLADKQFTVTLGDAMGCFRIDSYIKIHIKPVSSLDVPTVFTPNGDGINDVVYVAGWGIKNLLEFKIYNRWGAMVFSSNDLAIGWDGTYNGVPQNMETYVYTVVAETYVDEKPLTKRGYIKIMR